MSSPRYCICILGMFAPLLLNTHLCFTHINFKPETLAKLLNNTKDSLKVLNLTSHNTKIVNTIVNWDEMYPW